MISASAPVVPGPGQALFDGAVLWFPCVNRDWAGQAGRSSYVRKCPESDGWPSRRRRSRWAKSRHLGVGCCYPQTSSKHMEGCRSRGRWDKPNTRHRCLLDARPAVNQGDVLATCPQQCKVAVVGRAGIARLSGGVDADAVVPVADIHDQPHRGTRDAAKIADAVACMHRRRAAAPHRQRTHVPRCAQVAWQERAGGVLEIAVVQAAPCPFGRVLTKSRRAVADCFGQCGEEECIALVPRPCTETLVRLLHKSKQRVDVARGEQWFEGWIRREAEHQGRL